MHASRLKLLIQLLLNVVLICKEKVGQVIEETKFSDGNFSHGNRGLFIFNT